MFKVLNVVIFKDTLKKELNNILCVNYTFFAATPPLYPLNRIIGNYLGVFNSELYYNEIPLHKLSLFSLTQFFIYIELI